MDVHDGLKQILEDERVTQGTDFKGHVEVREYYGHILKTLLKRYYGRKAYLFTCYRDRETENEEENQREYTMCAFSYDKNQCIPYIYSIKERKFIEIDIDKLIELQEDGLVLGSSNKADGVGLIKRIIARRKKEKLKEEGQR